MPRELDAGVERAGHDIAIVFMLRQLYTVVSNETGTGRDGLLAMRADLERQLTTASAKDETHEEALADIKRAAMAVLRSVFEPITAPDDLQQDARTDP